MTKSDLLDHLKMHRDQAASMSKKLIDYDAHLQHVAREEAYGHAMKLVEQFIEDETKDLQKHKGE